MVFKDFSRKILIFWVNALKRQRKEEYEYAYMFLISLAIYEKVN